MKSKLVSSTLLIFFLFKVYSQTGKVTYEVKSILDSQSERAKKFAHEVELMNFTLSFNSINSSFKREKNIPKDKMVSRIATTLIGHLGNSFQNINESTSFFNTKIGDKEYQVDISSKMKGWKLTNESITINNYNCYKAILKEYNNRSETYYETVAWYTPEIPIGFGPTGYGGLPGLILQLEFNKAIFIAKSIQLNPDIIEIQTIIEGNKITTKEMAKLMKARRKVTED